MSENQACQSQVHMIADKISEGKPRRRGLNRRLKPGLQGGLVLTHYLITWPGNRRSMRHSRGVIMLRPRALLEISLILYTIAARQMKLYIIIFDWRRIYSQVWFSAIQHLQTQNSRVSLFRIFYFERFLSSQNADLFRIVPVSVNRCSSVNIAF
jgi:hypothetical protein